MKLRTLLVMSLMGLSSFAFADAKVPAGTYTLDSAHTRVGFEISHLVISSVEGQFTKYDGKVAVGEKLANSSTDVEIETASIDTGNADRDKHLKSPDFFDSEKFPKMTFKSNKVIVSGKNIKIPGELTIKGVTKPVTLTGKVGGYLKDPFGLDRIAAAVSGKISRKEFGLTWNKMIEAGPMVGDEVTLDLKVEATKK